MNHDGIEAHLKLVTGVFSIIVTFSISCSPQKNSQQTYATPTESSIEAYDASLFNAPNNIIIISVQLKIKNVIQEWSD